MLCRTKLFNQMVIIVLIEEHLSKPTHFDRPSNLIGQDTCHLFSKRGGDFDSKLKLVPR